MPGPRSPGHAARPGDAWRTRHAQLKQRGPERRVHHDHVDLTPVCSVVGRLWHRQKLSARITQPCDVHPCDVPLPTAVCSIFCPQVVSGRRLAYPHRRHPRFFTGLRSLSASDAGPEVLGRRRVNRCAAAARTRAARLHALTVLLERAAGPLSRCTSTLAMVAAAIDTYSSGCAWLSASMWPLVVAVRSGRAARAICLCARWSDEMTRPVAHLGCTRESAYDLGCF